LDRKVSEPVGTLDYCLVNATAILFVSLVLIVSSLLDESQKPRTMIANEATSTGSKIFSRINNGTATYYPNERSND
jgi:hypothetical protein